MSRCMCMSRQVRAVKVVQGKVRRMIDDRIVAQQALQKLRELSAQRHAAATKLQSVMRRHLTDRFLSKERKIALEKARERQRVIAATGVSPKSLVRDRMAQFAGVFQRHLAKRSEQDRAPPSPSPQPSPKKKASPRKISPITKPTPKARSPQKVVATLVPAAKPNTVSDQGVKLLQSALRNSDTKNKKKQKKPKLRR